jgi:transposase-like protein
MSETTNPLPQDVEPGKVRLTLVRPPKKRGPALTQEAVDEIRLKCEQGRSTSAIAQEYDVTTQTILNIRNGRTWRQGRDPAPSGDETGPALP